MSARLQVLFVTPWYPMPNRPYWGIFVREHAKAVMHYADVTVLHVAGAVDGATRYALTKNLLEEEEHGIPAYVLQYGRSVPSQAAHLMRHLHLRRALQQLIRHVARPDVIHAHVHRVALQSVLVGKQYGIPVVITEQHSAFAGNQMSKLDQWEARLAFGLAGTVMPVSQALQRAIQAKGIRANYQIIPNVVDTDFFTNSATQPRPATPIKLLCVANMPESHIKGYPYLFDALAALDPRDDWRLDIIGDGPMLATYVERVKTLGLADKITFHGYQTKSAIVQAMQNAHLFVLASVWDNMPCVLVEAMAMGLPIVATRTGGIPEVVTPEVGLLAEPANSASLQEALTTMLARMPHYSAEQIATIARTTYSMHVIGQQFNTIYQQHLKQPRSV